MVQFAVVGRHGREPLMRAAWCALLISTTIAPALAQDAARFQDLLPDLASAIASAIAPSTQISLVIESSSSAPEPPGAAREALTSALMGRGVTVAQVAPGIAPVRVECQQNLRERSCVAEIQRGASRDVFIAARPLEPRLSGDAHVDGSLLPAIELYPLFAQRQPILDLLVAGDRMLVLDPGALTVYEQKAEGWLAARSTPLMPIRPWPRDVRGRVRADNEMVDIFMPGITCSTTWALTAMRCAERRAPWPLGVENIGLEPARNYFSTPEGLTFYGAASLDAEAGARWLVAARSGSLTMLSAAREAIPTMEMATDLAAIRSRCGTQSFVVAASTTDGRELLRLMRVTDRRIVAVAPPRLLPGAVTALWPMTDPSMALLVTHDAGVGRYDAFRVSVSCRR